MSIVKPGVDTRPVSFGLQLTDGIVGMSCVGGCAVYGEFHIRRAEEVFQRLRYRASSTSMSSGEFGMGRSWCEWKPGGIRFGLRIAVYISVWNSGYWTPKAEVILSVPTTDAGIRKSYRQHSE